MPATTDHVTTKLRPHVHKRATRLADRHNSNRTEILDAATAYLERAGEEAQRDEIARVRRAHPAPYPRTGRGNRRPRQASPAAGR